MGGGGGEVIDNLSIFKGSLSFCIRNSISFFKANVSMEDPCRKDRIKFGLHNQRPLITKSMQSVLKLIPQFSTFLL